MSKAKFPTLLSKKATMMLGLTRYDLMVFGISLMMSSWIGVKGLTAWITNIVILIVFRNIRTRLPKGIFQHLFDSKRLEWSYKIQEIKK